MTTMSSKKEPQETWRAWAPDDLPEVAPLLNRAEFLERLAQRGLDVTEADLRWWEWEGYLPRPERRWDPEVRARRAYYPAWMVAVVFALRELQAEGRHLDAMGPALRDAAQRAARSLHRALPDTTVLADALRNDALGKELRNTAQLLAQSLQGVPPQETTSNTGEENATEEQVIDALTIEAGASAVHHAIMHEEVKPTLIRLAHLSSRYGKALHTNPHPITRVSVTFTDSSGRDWVSSFAVPPEDADENGNDG